MDDVNDLNSQPGGEERGTLLKTAARCFAGWFIGYLISVVTSLLLFTVGGVDPEKPAAAWVMSLVAMYGVIFSIVGAVVGANFSRKNALGIGASIALTTGAMALWSWSQTPAHAHWTQLIAIFLMAPAAQFGALFRRLDY
jgi:hypothetical protein